MMVTISGSASVAVASSIPCERGTRVHAKFWLRSESSKLALAADTKPNFRNTWTQEQTRPTVLAASKGEVGGGRPQSVTGFKLLPQMVAFGCVSSVVSTAQPQPALPKRLNMPPMPFAAFAPAEEGGLSPTGRLTPMRSGSSILVLILM